MAGRGLMSDIAHIDFETKSRTNLLTEGVYKYAVDPSTQIICLGWAFNDEDVELWWPGQPFPERLYAHFEDGAPRSIHAQNSAFQRLLSWYVLYPDFDMPEPFKPEDLAKIEGIVFRREGQISHMGAFVVNKLGCSYFTHEKLFLNIFYCIPLFL